jgi:DNA-binding transcriptional MerR regulator
MFTREEVAERAGVDVAYVDRLIDADIIHPDAAGRSSLADVRRTRFVKSLELAGVSLEGMATAVREGTLSFSYLDAGAVDESFATLSTTTFRELSERTGVSLELLSVVREAVGFAQPRPEDLVRDDELDVVPAIKLQLESGFRPAAIERYVRGADPRGRCAARTPNGRTLAVRSPRRPGSRRAHRRQATERKTCRCASSGDRG